LRHLVTGGSGFLGNLIARHFNERGEQVTVLDRWEDETRPHQIQFIEGDVLNRDLIRASMEGVDIVHHTAALVPLTKSVIRFNEVNIEGSRIVAEEAARARVKCFIHMSSSSIFGASPCPADNNSPLRPLEAYGKSKLEGEAAVKAVAERTGMKLISVRPRTIIARERLGIFQILFDWIKDDCNIYVIGDGSNKIQFLHADDLIDAYMAVYESGRSGFYNVGTDRFQTLKEDLEGLCLHAKSKARVLGLPEHLTVSMLRILDKVGLSPLAPYHYLTYGETFYFDLKPLFDLGWKPKYSNLEMLTDSYDSFVTNYNELMRDNPGASPHRKRVKERVLKILKSFSKAK